MIAIDFAATWPDRVQSLVLCDTAPVIGTADMWNQRIDTLRQHGMDYLAEAILGRWFAPAFMKENTAATRGYSHMLTRMEVAGYTGTCEAIRDADLTAAAKSIQVPTLVLVGAADPSTPPQLVSGLKTLIPHSEYYEVPGAGHLPCVEKPAETADRIAKFL
jgi:3-oxoadipate enol-lactonase